MNLITLTNAEFAILMRHAARELSPNSPTIGATLLEAANRLDQMDALLDQYDEPDSVLCEDYD